MTKSHGDSQPTVEFDARHFQLRLIDHVGRVERRILLDGLEVDGVAPLGLVEGDHGRVFRRLRQASKG